MTAAISRIPEQDRGGIKYPHVLFEEHEQRWIPDAEVAADRLHRLHREKAG